MVEDGRLGRARGAGVVVGGDRVEKLGSDGCVERSGPLLDESQAEVDVPEQLALRRRQEERTAVELDGAAGVVQERCCEEEVAPEASVELRGVTAEGRDCDRVLEEAAAVAMMRIRCRRKCAEARSEVRIGDETRDGRTKTRVGELVGEELEEPVELVEVAPRLGYERGGVGFRRLHRANLELQTVAKPLNTSEHAHGVSLAEAPVEKLDVVPDARVDTAGRIDELEREIRSAASSAQALLPRDGEDAFDDSILGELCDRRGDAHGRRVYEERRTDPLTSPSVALLKPFRALRYDVRAAGPLENLVAPPHDVISADEREDLCRASPYNVVRLIRPDGYDEAARLFREWNERGILVREPEAAIWLLEEEFTDPDGRARTRRSLVARVRLERYGAGVVLPHERTSASAKQSRLELLRAVRTKLSPILLLHEGPPVETPSDRPPDLGVTFDGVRSRLWRVTESDAVARAIEAVRAPLIIADGHHRYETALRFHEEDGTKATRYVLAAVVSSDDEGLVIYPTHRVAGGAVPELNGRFRVTAFAGGAEAATERLARVPRDRPAFVMLRRDGAVLAEAEPEATSSLAALDTAVIDTLALEDVRFTPSATEAEREVANGHASAAFLVRSPTVEQVEAVALAGETMPRKSTYFFPKLTSGLLFSPFDE